MESPGFNHRSFIDTNLLQDGNDPAVVARHLQNLEIVRSYTRAFFDKYLQDKQPTLLDRAEREFRPESVEHFGWVRGNWTLPGKDARILLYPWDGGSRLRGEATRQAASSDCLLEQSALSGKSAALLPQKRKAPFRSAGTDDPVIARGQSSNGVRAVQFYVSNRRLTRQSSSLPHLASRVEAGLRGLPFRKDGLLLLLGNQLARR
jgi:hypothetical protein